MRRGLLCVLLAVAPAPGQPRPLARELTIVARVVDGGGRPLAGAGVAFAAADSVLTDALETPLARSENDGRVRLRVSLAAPEERLSPPTLLFAAKGTVAVAVEVGDDEPGLGTEAFDAGEVVLFAGTTLHGRLADAAGKPIAAARVSGRTCPTGPPSTRTAATAVRSSYPGKRHSAAEPHPTRSAVSKLDALTQATNRRLGRES